MQEFIIFVVVSPLFRIYDFVLLLTIESGWSEVALSAFQWRKTVRGEALVYAEGRTCMVDRMREGAQLGRRYHDETRNSGLRWRYLI